MKELNKSKFILHTLSFIPLFTLFLLLFWRLILKSNYISYGDNSFTFNKLAVTSWYSYLSNGIQGELTIFGQIYMNVFTKFFLMLNLNFETISKITFLLPIFTSLLVSFVVLYKISGNHLFAIVGASLFFLSSISVEHTVVSLMVYFLHVISIFLLSLVIFSNRDNHTVDTKRILLLITLSLLNFHPFYFIIYFVYILIYFLYISTNSLKIKDAVKYIVTFVTIVLINFYWLLPFISSVVKNTSTPASLYGDSNFKATLSSFIAQSKLFKIIIGSAYNISNFENNLLNVSIILVSFILFILLVISIFYSFKSKNEVSRFFSIVIIIFLSLSFWPNNYLLKSSWSFLMDKYSAFGFFRTFSRFSTTLLPTLIIIIAIQYRKLKNRKYINFVLIFLFFLTIYGRRDLMTGDFGGIVPVYEIPYEYQLLNKNFIEGSIDDTRVLSYPKTDYERYIWSKNFNHTEFPQVTNFLEYYLNFSILNSRYGNHIFMTEKFYKNIFDSRFCLNSEKYIEDLAKIDIDYVLLQKDLINMKGDIVSFNDYRDCLHNSNFSLMIDNRFFELYKINYAPKYEKKYRIKEIYPFYYTVDFDFSHRNYVELVFPQNFNIGWKVYYNDSSNFSFLKKNLIPLFNKELKVQNINNSPGNKWILRREDFSEDKIKLNLYYYPQIRVFIGCLVTIIIFTGLSSFWVYLLIKKMRSR